MPARRLRAAGLAVGAVLLLYLLAGYMTPRVAWVASERSPTGAFNPTARARSLAGALHVHTQRSHDALGGDTEVARAARAAGLDFVLITDHRAEDAAADVWNEPAVFRDDVLLVRGQEVSLGSDVGRLLIFGLDTTVTSWTGTLDQMATRLKRDNAAAIIAHSRSPRTRDSWRPRRTPGIVGWEVFDLADVGRARLHGIWAPFHILSIAINYPLGRGHLSLLALYREGFDRPAVAAFDSLARRNRLTAVAGVDAHPKERLSGRLVPGYGPFFRSLTNHVTVPTPLPDDPSAAADTLLAAIANGRVHISFGGSHNARDFFFRADTDHSTTATAGESITIRSDLALTAGFVDDSTPSRLLFRIMRDGTETAWIRGNALLWPVQRPGQYRLEVYTYSVRAGRLVWNLRPWIFTNPLTVSQN